LNRIVEEGVYNIKDTDLEKSGKLKEGNVVVLEH
jgi:hypothetical protein